MVKIGVVGLGKMGVSHASIIGGMPGVQLAAVCDSSPLVSYGFGKYSNVPVFRDVDEFLKQDLDGVIVATPNFSHREIIEKSIRHKLAIFCEKPLTLKAEDSFRLARALVELRIPNQVGYHYRFIETFKKAKLLVDSGLLGRAHDFRVEAFGPVVVKPPKSSWRTSAQSGGGCLYDYASHAINMLTYLCEDEFSCVGSINRDIWSEGTGDLVKALFTTNTGVSADICVNWSDPSYRKMYLRTTVEGEKGKIVVDPYELKVWLKEASEEFSSGWTSLSITDLKPNCSFYLRGEEYTNELELFVKSIFEGSERNVSDFLSAAETDRLIEDVFLGGTGRLLEKMSAVGAGNKAAKKRSRIKEVFSWR